MVICQIVAFLGWTGELVDGLGAGGLGPDVLRAMLTAAKNLAMELQSGGGVVQRELVMALVDKVTIGAASIRIELKRQALAARLLSDAAPDMELGGTIAIGAPLRIARRGVETKLIIDADGAAAADRAPDAALIKAVARGHAWFDDLASGRARSINEIAARERLTARYVARLLDLAFLPPRLVEDILAGRQPVGLTADGLTRSERSVLWADND